MLNGVAVTELAPPAGLEELRERYRTFMEEHVYPNEAALEREDAAADELVGELRVRARAEGLWAPHLPPEAGGTGQGFLAYAHLNEEIGRSIWAQLVFNCQAPDAGNGEILHLFGTEEQKERWLKPLVEGEIRSFFSMTEPEVSGSDPTTLRTRAVRDGDDWVIDGHKWFSSGVEREAFGSPLADKQTVQNWIADSAAEIQACRLMTLDAAHKIDQGDDARVEVSLIKFYAARVLNDVIDRAIQVHGALGLTDETPLASMWAMARGGRIYDGPDEVHRMVVSRRILKSFEQGDGWRFS